jgi:nucleoid-associated protein YgaU
MSPPTRATITVTTPSVQQGQASKGPTVETFEVQFNPSEYVISKSATWDHKPSTSAANTTMPQFMGANSAELTFELFLDATQTKPADLVKTVDTLFFCCSPLVKTKQQKKPSAPFVVLEWGQLKFTGNVKSVAAKYTLFNEKGEPLRATCNVTLQELPTGKPFTNPTSGGREPTTSHRVVAGDTLASIAWAEYQDPTMWRHVAAANGIDDPLRLREGTMILVPSPDADDEAR